MKERELSENEVSDFGHREESHFFDNKSSAISGKGVQKIAVAFANADGGEFVVGIKDAKEEPNPAARWNGALAAEELNFVFQNLLQTSPLIKRVRFGLILRPNLSHQIA